MMSIGEFAQMSGLTVKALRHYDERELLIPARTDPVSRYRGYSGAQLREAVTVRLLREAGLPVEEVRAALAGPEPVPVVLTRFQQRLVAERAAQDAALAEAEATLTAWQVPVVVTERDVDPTHFAAVVLSVPIDPGPNDVPDPDWDERANAAFGALHRALAARDAAPCGPWWSSFGDLDDDGQVAMSLCWPLAAPAPANLSVGAHRVRTGTLAAGHELVARCDHADGAPEGDVPHPAWLALLETAAARGADTTLGDVRQIGVVDDAGTPVGVELALRIG